MTLFSQGFKKMHNEDENDSSELGNEFFRGKKKFAARVSGGRISFKELVIKPLKKREKRERGFAAEEEGRRKNPGTTF